MFRPRLVGLSLAVAMAAVLAAAPAPAAAHDGTPHLSLPGPTGRYRVGTTVLHLVDGSRTDPLASTPRKREVMIRLWYPAVRSRQPLAGYQAPNVSAYYIGFLNPINHTAYPANLLAFPTSSRQDAPAVTGTRHPVVLYTPDNAGNATDSTGLTEELASRGYVVAGIEHTYDAGAVEFPGGRIETRSPSLQADDPRLRAVRTADIRFVLTSLAALAAGGDPDADHRVPPRGLGGALDLTRVAAVGQGLGSLAVIDTMRQDRRVHAGLILNGDPLTPVRLHGPVMMVGDAKHRPAGAPDWAAFHDRLRGPRPYVVVQRAIDDDLNDIALFKSRMVGGPGFQVGTIDGDRAMAVQRAYVTAWLDLTMRGRPSPLLRGDSPLFPEVEFQS